MFTLERFTCAFPQCIVVCNVERGFSRGLAVCFHNNDFFLSEEV